MGLYVLIKTTMFGNGVELKALDTIVNYSKQFKHKNLVASKRELLVV